MKNNSLKYAEIAMLVIAIVLSFITVNEIIPRYIFLIVASITGLYYFPSKIIILLKNNVLGRKAWYIISSFIISYIIVFSAVLPYTSDNELFRTVFAVAGIINSLLIFYFIFNRKYHSLFWIHFGYGFVVSTIFFF